MLDNQILSALKGNVEWVHQTPTIAGVTLVFRVDGTLRGLMVLSVVGNVVIRPLAYHDAIKAAGSVEAQSRERGETPVYLLTEEERDTLGLLRRGKG